MGNELAVREEMPLAQLGEVLVKSGFFQDTRDVAQAIVKVLAGRELGFGAISSMTGVYIVKGRPAISAGLMAAAIKRSGKYTYRVIALDETVCEIAFFEGKEEVGRSRFTVDDARKAGTQNMDRFPRNMLFARALSNGAKWFCPDIFGGPIYTPEELGASVNEDGEVIESTFVESKPEPQYRQAQPPKSNGNGKADGSEPPTEKAWEQWKNLSDEAISLNIGPGVPPENVTIGELRAMYAELNEKVKAAKAA